MLCIQHMHVMLDHKSTSVVYYDWLRLQLQQTITVCAIQQVLRYITLGMGVSVSSIFLVEAITHETPTITQSSIDCCLESGTQALFGQLLLNGVRFSWGTHIYTQAQVDYPSGKLS